MNVLCLLLGAALAGPLWVLLSRWWLRRTIRRTRRIAAAARRQEHLVELGALTGGLAHEIKNPLSTIKVNLQLLIEELQAPGADEGDQRRLRRLQGVAGEVSRIQEILDDFLRYAGRHELQLANVDLGLLVNDLADFFGPQAEAAHVRLRAFTPAEPIIIRADADLLKQALLNLMLNAQQAMADGGELIIRAGTGRRWATLEVIDTGPGIPPDVASRIFDAYFTTKPRGSGLGLATAERIVREHRGQLRLDTEVGKGTRFVIRLPLANR